MRSLQKSRSHLMVAGPQAGVSLPGVPVPQMFTDRRTTASDGRPGKPRISRNRLIQIKRSNNPLSIPVLI